MVGAHDADAIENHASNNSETGERDPIERSPLDGSDEVVEGSLGIGSVAMHGRGAIPATMGLGVHAGVDA